MQNITTIGKVAKKTGRTSKGTNYVIQWREFIGGLVLVILGIKIVIEHLFFSVV
jgi:putative Mn2+ efflux pump MntP